MQKTQQGGTLIGFVVGLLVGLGLALAVAVYVTKVPVPFVDRGISRKPTQDAIEAERNRNWNPNSAIGGKPAATAPAATPPSGDTPAISAPGAATPAPKEPAAAPTKPADPLGDLMRERTQPATPAAPATAPTAAASADKEPFVYFVQAGAFRTQADADSQKARLAMLGFNARVTEREQAGQTVFRVRMGPFDAKTDADTTQAKLIANGQEAALVRVQR